jgi:mRNA interferase RelE/StbE
MGRGRGRDRLKRYAVYVTPDALREARGSPGNVRQRLKRAISELAESPRPPESRALSIPSVDAEIRRLRIDQWRVVYAVTESDLAVDVLAVRKRPPYDYGDLADLIAEALLPQESPDEPR